MKKLVLMMAVAITSITCLAKPSHAIGLLWPAVQKCSLPAKGNEYNYIITFSDTLLSSYQLGGAAISPPTDPVLMVISNQEFQEQGFTDTRCCFECTDFEYVADGRNELILLAGTYVEESYKQRPQRIPFIGALYLNPKDPNELIFEFRFADNPEEPHTIVFVGGWGSSMYQY